MASTTTDRRFGVNAGVSFKAPCKGATTGNVTLSGEQTIDGVSFLSGDRILVKNQTATSENGIYVVDTGSWSRAKDFDGSYDVVQGTLISVISGSSNANSVWKINSSGSLIPGSSNISFSEALFSDSGTLNFIQGESSTVSRSVQDKLRESLTVKDYGASGGGLIDDSSAITSMISSIGYVRFSRGNYLIDSNITVTGIMHFDEGAYVTVSSGKTLTVQNAIESSRQFIFRGDGVYSLENTTSQGENARQIHASFFGAFPAADSTSDQGAAINKAFSSLGNTRESEVLFDIGNYYMTTQVTVTRGGKVKGAGTRRTVFKLGADGFAGFITNNVACTFDNIQFENDTTALPTGRTSEFIRIAHGECEIYNVNVGDAFHCIVVAGNNCRVDNILGAVGNNFGAGSAIVNVLNGGCRVENLIFNTSSNGHESMVLVGGANQTATISNFQIKNIDHITPSISVKIDAQAGNITRGIIAGIRYNGFAGTPPSNFMHIVTSSTFSIDQIVIESNVCTSFATNGIRLEQNSTGNLRDIVIDDTTIAGSSGDGLQFVRTAGTLSEIKVGSGFNARTRANEYTYSGTTSGIKISPSAIDNVLPAYCYDFTVSDDGVSQIVLNRGVPTGILLVSIGYLEYGIFAFRASSTPNVTSISVSTNVNTATTSLSGTTGTDAKFTVGFTDGNLYFENRLGSSQRISANILTGVS